MNKGLTHECGGRTGFKKPEEWQEQISSLDDVGGKHPLSREQGGCLDKVYFERGFIYMTGAKWLENKKWSVVLMQKDQQRGDRANWGSEELNSLSATGIHKWGLTLAYTYRNSVAGRSPESHGFSVLFAQKSSTSANGADSRGDPIRTLGGSQDSSCRGHKEWRRFAIMPGIQVVSTPITSPSPTTCSVEYQYNPEGFQNAHRILLR